MSEAVSLQCTFFFSCKDAVRLQVQGVVLLRVGSQLCIGVEKRYSVECIQFSLHC